MDKLNLSILEELGEDISTDSSCSPTSSIHYISEGSFTKENGLLEKEESLTSSSMKSIEDMENAEQQITQLQKSILKQQINTLFIRYNSSMDTCTKREYLHQKLKKYYELKEDYSKFLSTEQTRFKNTLELDPIGLNWTTDGAVSARLPSLNQKFPNSKLKRLTSFHKSVWDRFKERLSNANRSVRSSNSSRRSRRYTLGHLQEQELRGKIYRLSQKKPERLSNTERQELKNAEQELREITRNEKGESPLTEEARNNSFIYANAEEVQRLINGIEAIHSGKIHLSRRHVLLMLDPETGTIAITTNKEKILQHGEVKKIKPLPPPYFNLQIINHSGKVKKHRIETLTSRDYYLWCRTVPTLLKKLGRSNSKISNCSNNNNNNNHNNDSAQSKSLNIPKDAFITV